jgi:LysM repeat protein
MNRIYYIIFSLVFLSLQMQATPHYRKHIVVKGETVFSIAHLYGMKVNDLVKINPILKTKKKIRPGQQLNVHWTKPAGAEASKTLRKDTLAHKAKLAGVPSTPDTPYSEEDKQARSSSDTKNAFSTTSNDDPAITLAKS